MGIIQRQFRRELPRVHVARLRIVFAAVFTALRCGELTLTALGRAIAERTTHKHGIKRIDRLLGNVHLHDEQLAFYAAIARRIMAPSSRPTVIVDWTAVTPELWALVAAVSFQGRALTIYAETHPISRYSKPHVNWAFLKRLKLVLPPGCAPVILADAGFRAPFMELVLRMGWDYVVRLRGRAEIRFKVGHGWERLPSLFGNTGHRPNDFGSVEIGRRRRFVSRLVGIKRPVHHRPYHSSMRRRHQRHTVVTWRERKSAHQPWILATSLDIEPPRVIALYTRRMQVEETFRDTKDPRFGLSLGFAHPRSEQRANVLLLLASLAHLFALLLGIAAEAAHLHRGFQANTLVTRRVLSLVTIGRLLIASENHVVPDGALNLLAWRSFRARIADALSF